MLPSLILYKQEPLRDGVGPTTHAQIKSNNDSLWLLDCTSRSPLADFELEQITCSKVSTLLGMLPLLFLICVTAISSNAHHDPHCNPANVQVCVDSEEDPSKRLNLVCVESRGERPLATDVQWHKNGTLHMDSTRIHRQRARLIFEEVLVSDEGNWTCSNGSLSPQFTLYGECGNVATWHYCT